MVTPDLLPSAAADVVSRLEAAGVRFRLDGEHLRLSPRDAVTPDVVAALRAHKDDVTIILQCRDAGVEARREAFARALSTWPVGPLVFTPPASPTSGQCFSCGDRVDGRGGRCWRCLLACRLALGVVLVPAKVM